MGVLVKGAFQGALRESKQDATFPLGHPHLASFVENVQLSFEDLPVIMTSALRYASEAPPREVIDALPGATLLEFGTDWCGYCRAAESVVSAALAGHPRVKHLKVEDGSGRPLGRSFRVKLWPTLILLDNGKEVGRLVRPTDAAAVAQALTHIDSLSGDQ